MSTRIKSKPEILLVVHKEDEATALKKSLPSYKFRIVKRSKKYHNSSCIEELVLGDLAAIPSAMPVLTIRGIIRFTHHDRHLDDVDRGSHSDFPRIHGGRDGVLELIAGIKKGDSSCRIVRSTIPGHLAQEPSQRGSYTWQKIWVPNGYQETLADLRTYGRSLSRLELFFLEVGSALGDESCTDVYEVHLTVNMNSNQTFHYFRDVCSDLGIKAIHVELPEGSTPSQMITASIHRGTLTKVRLEAKEISKYLREHGLPVVRSKLESFLDGSQVPQDASQLAPETEKNYFEFHVKIDLDGTLAVSDLRRICRKHHAHLSRTSSNRLSDGVEQRFATMRIYGTSRDVAEPYFDDFLAVLRQTGLRLSNIIREYAVDDSCPELDDGWADGVPCRHCREVNCMFGDSAGKVGAGFFNDSLVDKRRRDDTPS